MEPSLFTTREQKVTFFAAYTALCIIWGSTYLGVRFAIATLPPMLMAGTRFLLAGGILFLWARMRGAALPNHEELMSCAIVGILLTTICNGGLTFAMGRIPSSIGALIGTSVPMWVAIVDWLRPGGIRPRGGVFAGLLMGFSGIILLVQPWKLWMDAETSITPHVDIVGIAVAMMAAATWAIGSVIAGQRKLPASPQMSTGIQLALGGLLLLLFGFAKGEAASTHLEQASMQSVIAFVYLVIFGSIVAFTSYAWLLRNVPPTLASSYTYINPIVAVLLGWSMGGEPVTPQMLLAMVIIIAAVLVIARFRSTVPSNTPANASSSVQHTATHEVSRTASEAS